MIFSSFDFFINNTNPEYIASHQLSPLLEIKMVLQGTELTFAPSLDAEKTDSMQELFLSIIEEIYSLAEQVPVLEGAETYVSQLFRVPRLQESSNILLDRLEEAAAQCFKYKSIFEVYDYLWRGDREEYMKNFLKVEQEKEEEETSRPSSSMGESHDDTGVSDPQHSHEVSDESSEDEDGDNDQNNSARINRKKHRKKSKASAFGDDEPEAVIKGPSNKVLDEFDIQITRFDDLHKQIMSLPLSRDIDGWLRLDSRVFKHKLSNLVQLWRDIFTQYLYEIVTSSLDDYSSFISDTTASLTTRPGPPKPGM